MPSPSGLFEVDVKVTDQLFILSYGQLERAERLHEGRVGREYLLHVRRENFATVERNAGVVPAIDEEQWKIAGLRNKRSQVQPVPVQRACHLGKGIDTPAVTH